MSPGCCDVIFVEADYPVRTSLVGCPSYRYWGQTDKSGRRGLKLDLALQKETPRFQRLVVDYEDNEVSSAEILGF